MRRQFSMLVYTPGNHPTRMRSLGIGWTDGVGHPGAGAAYWRAQGATTDAAVEPAGERGE